MDAVARASVGVDPRPPGPDAAQRRRRGGLRATLLLLIALTLTPVAALMTAEHLRRLDEGEAAQLAMTGRIAASRARDVSQAVVGVQRLLDVIGANGVVRAGPERPGCSDELAAMAGTLPQYTLVGIVDGNARLVCASRPFNRAAPPAYADRSWFTDARAAPGLAIGTTAAAGRLTGVPVIGFAQHLSGTSEHVAFAGLDLAWFGRWLGDVELPADGALVVLDRGGAIVARMPAHAPWIGTLHPDADRLAAHAREGVRALRVRGPDGVDRLGSVEPVEGTDGALLVFFGLPAHTAFDAEERRFALSLAGLALIALASFGGAWIGAERLVLARARRLHDAAERLAQGDSNARTGMHGRDELGALGEHFDRMAVTIEQREAGLQRVNRALAMVTATHRELLHSRDDASLLGEMCRAIGEHGGYAGVWVGRRCDDARRSVEAVARWGVDDAFLAALGPISWADEPLGRGPVGTAIREQRAVCVPDLLAAIDVAGWRELAKRHGFASALAVPLVLGGAVWGAVVIYAGRRDAFNAEEARIVGDAANDLAFGLSGLRLKARERAAHDANRVKSEFLASMSHELRTPLNAVIGFAEVLHDGLAGEVNAQQREYLADILAAGTHLLDLINDILDLSKVEAGKMELELEDVPVASSLRSALGIVREKAAKGGVELDLDVDAACGDLRADPRKLKQIVYNLLANAVKFTPAGGRVTLRARRVGAPAVPPADPAAPGPWLEVEVADTGIGIAADDLPRLFTPFSQIDSSLARQHGGSGLGLALVRSLVALHGGAVDVTSEPGRGSSFRFWLPARAPAPAGEVALEPLPPPPAMHAAAGRDVLVVEDDAASFELLRAALAQAGWTVRRAASAGQARDEIARQRPDLIVLDLLLPDDDGWRWLAWLRGQDGGASVPVIVASVVADERKGQALGALAVLQKPFSRDALLRALAPLAPQPPAA